MTRTDHAAHADRPLCTRCESIRLSSQDIGTICIYCQDDLAALRTLASQAKRQPGYCWCGQPSAYDRSILCADCSRKYNRERRAARVFG